MHLHATDVYTQVQTITNIVRAEYEYCSCGVKYIIHYLPTSKRRRVHAISYIILMRFLKLFRAFL